MVTCHHNCAQHLNGLNEGGINQNFQCAMMTCPQTYLPDEFKQDFDFDRSADMPSPQGNEGDNKQNSIQKGLCFTDSLKFNQTEVGQIARCALDLYDKHLNGSFLWTAKNEIEARWNYISAWDMLWLNKTEVPADQIKTYPDFDPKNITETGEVVSLDRDGKTILKEQKLEFTQ
jgi:hypothetical protein